MIALGFVFLTVALVFALLGFRGLMTKVAEFSRILFFAFLALFIVTTFIGMSHSV